MKNNEELTDLEVIEILLGVQERHEHIVDIASCVLKLEKLVKGMQSDIEDRKKKLFGFGDHEFDDFINILEKSVGSMRKDIGKRKEYLLDLSGQGFDDLIEILVSLGEALDND